MSQPKTSTEALVEFLRARLDEDERRARDARPGPWSLTGHPDEVVLYSGPDEVMRGPLRDGAHIAHHNPARVLAEVDAKRRIVELCAEEDGGVEIGVGVSPEQWLAQSVLRLLAEVYADRPGYRQEWRPA